VPYNIDVSEGTNVTNYKNKVLYFFDLKDLKNILHAQNLDKSSSDTTHFNEKRLLCKIISLSFIKIYIIVKSIYQTFNIYNSLITNNKGNVYENERFGEGNFSNDFNFSGNYIPPPFPEETPPTFAETPPLSEETPPLSEETPPLSEEVPPLSEEVPPLSEETPPKFAETPPLSEEVPPLSEETPPLSKEVPPLLEEVPPLSQEVPPIFAEPSPLSKEAEPPLPEVIPIEPSDTIEKDKLIEENKKINPQEIQNGGNPLLNIFDKLLNRKKNTPVSTNNTFNSVSVENNFNSSPSPTLSPTLSPSLSSTQNQGKESTKLQRSNNIFYSIFVILFEDSENEQLVSTNFNAKFLTKGLDKIDNITLSSKISKIIQYILDRAVFSKEFLGDTCLLFRDDNFKFMKLETSDTESKEATFFIKEVDKEFTAFDKIIATKRALLGSILNKENKEPLEKYSNSLQSQKFANYKFFNAFKSHLKTMIKNYFKTRVNLYNNIVKELFVFDKKSNTIITLNSRLTYKYISELSKKTEIILLDLHIVLFKTLNSILTDCVNEINIMNKTENSPNESPLAEPNTMTYIGGIKTKKHKKISIKKHKKRSIKKHKKRSIKKHKKRTTKSRK